MSRIRQYHRPETTDEALALIANAGVVPIGGGTTINGLPDVVPDEVVDLQALRLDQIEFSDGALHVGAMVTLADFAAHEVTPAAVLQLSRLEAPNTIRNAATVGGAIGTADPESPLLAALLAYDSVVTVLGSDGREDLGLDEVLGDSSLLDGRLVETVHLAVGGAAAWEGTARTPADRPIVLVVGRQGPDGPRLAATGVAATPVVFTIEATDDLDPPGDFRGSPEYRRHLAGVLAHRVLERLSS